MKRTALLACAAAVAGCASLPELSMPDFSDWFSREKALEVGELRRSAICNSPSADTRVWLFADLAGARAWQAARGVDLIGSEPLPDGPYAIVEMGARRSGGYGIAVSRIAGRRGDDLILKATFIAPGPGSMVTQALTSPCVLVSLPQAHYAAVQVIDQAGAVRARSGEGT